MKLIKLSLAAALLATLSYAEEKKSDLEVSANVALTSNYVWRGMTQSRNSPAVQGGFDLSYKGFYTGVWGSNINFDSKASVEIDAYLGYAGEIGKFSYDVGYCQYMYPNETDELNFGEAYLSLGYDFDVVSISAKYYLGIDTNDVANQVTDYEPGDAWEAAVSVPLPMDITIDALYGSYDDAQDGNKNNFGDYYSATLTKAFGKYELSLAYTVMDYDQVDGGYDGDGKEDNIVVTLGASF